MKRLLTIFIWLTVAACSGYAKNWCEELIGFLSEQNNVDRNVAVSRDPESHEITGATYDFRFTSENLYKTIANNMQVTKQKPTSTPKTRKSIKQSLLASLTRDAAGIANFNRSTTEENSFWLPSNQVLP